MKERCQKEPANMDLNERVQKLALKVLFSSNSQERSSAQQELDYNRSSFDNLTIVPTSLGSPNTTWVDKAKTMISDYRVFPVQIFDQEVKNKVEAFSDDLTFTRGSMTEQIFAECLTQDIICLQETKNLHPAMFLGRYQIELPRCHNNGIAWNKERFKLLEKIDSIVNKAVAVRLYDKTYQKTILVTSGHLTGCNPYYPVEDSEVKGLFDSGKGDWELREIVRFFEQSQYANDLKVIGMDSNVTALHPRLSILKNSGYQMDHENYVEPTCTNPYYGLNIRIDWIAVKSNNENPISIVNLPLSSVQLNDIQTNMSDHKPIAAQVAY